MKTKPVVLLCWIQVALAAAIVLLNVQNWATRPAAGFEYSRRTGEVVSVIPGGPAERAGIRLGDRIRKINGHAIGVEVYPFFFVRAGEGVLIELDRGTVALETVTAEQLRHGQLRAGGVHAIAAISAYLTIPLHLWMIGMGIALLVLRAEDRHARLAAIAQVSWAGSMFMYRAYGFGIVLGAMPALLRVPLVAIDAYFSAAFFALCVHFAMVFPKNERRRWWEFVPYVVALPIFIETLVNNLSRLEGNVRPVKLPLDDAYSTVGTVMLLAALVILGVRLLRIGDANARRRMQLVFLSLLPGSLAFIIGYVFGLLRLGHLWTAGSRMLHMPATILGSAIFTYAVVRHRMFNIRVLVRRSIRYALAKGTLLALMTLPVVGLAVFLYIHRDDSLAVLLTGTPAIYVLLLLPLALVIRYRKRLLEALDRRFFREQYDARRVLLHVTSMIRGGSDMLALSRAAVDEIDRALHPKHISLWQTDPGNVALHRGLWRGEEAPANVEPLHATGTLASLLGGDEEPLDMYGRATRAVLQRLPDAEREWLQGVDPTLLVPLLIEKRLVGLLVLGERKSEEPYSGEDRELLRTLGAQLALTLDYTRLKQSPSLVWAPHSIAPLHLHLSDVLQLCPRCGRCYSRDEERCEADAQALVPESGVPRIIEDKYVVTKLLGRGGMGSVYLANQTRLNRNVAVKVLLSHLVGSSSMRSRFEREARIVARLRHPAIVTIHDFGVLTSGHAYLVMEYLDGDTLRKVILRGAQPLDAALEILTPVGDAIDTAHRAGVVHRDLKPENIMLVAEGAPRVLDFGLAKMSGPVGEDEQTLIQSGHSAGVVGTLMYMAPEVLSGKVADARSDQYSLAIIAWELLAGHHPLGFATDLASVVRGHTEAPMMPIRERVPDVPPHVNDAIARALSKDPEARFSSVGELVKALTESNH